MPPRYQLKMLGFLPPYNDDEEEERERKNNNKVSSFTKESINYPQNKYILVILFSSWSRHVAEQVDSVGDAR